MGTRNNPATYLKGKSVKIWAKFTVTPSAISNAKIRATSSDALGNLGEQTVSFTSGESGYVALTAASSTPNYVTKLSVTWTWKFRDINGNGSGDAKIGVASQDTTGPHPIYVLRAKPASPWQDYGNYRVWTDVLDYSTNYADAKESEANIVQEIVEAVYGSGIVYDAAQHWTYAGYTQFHLTDFLAALAAAGADDADCRDFANWFHVLSGSVGVSGQYRVFDRTSSPYNFTTNYILPAQGSWTTTTWNYHQVGWWSSKVADPSLELDNDANPESSPHTAKLSTGDMTQSQYLDKLTETPDVTDVETGTCSLVE